MLNPASTLRDVELQYDYDNDWTNGIDGIIANTTRADSEISFVIPGWAIHWAGTDGTMYYRIHQWTADGQHYYSTNETISPNSPNFRVLDNDVPKCKFVSQNATISYHQWMQAIYNITDQVNASGFDFDNDPVYLYYKIGLPPSGPSDGTPIPYNASLNSGITAGITQVNYANFTIPSSAYSYGDTVYHWVVVADRAGNINDTYAYLQSFVVGDSVTPTHVSAAQNSQNASFHQDKLVTFTVVDPARGSGIDDTSVKCYWANNSAFSTLAECTLQGSAGDDYTFLIPKEFAHYGNLDKTIYFRINASDYENNAILSGNVYSYQVTDNQAPQMTLIWQNFTSNPNYDGAWVIWRATFTDPDAPISWPSTCSKLSTAYLYVRNGTPAVGQENRTSQYALRISGNDTVAGNLSIDLEFTIGPAELSAKFNMYYLIQVNDSRYGVFNYTGNFHVNDSVIPYVRFEYARNTTGGTIINYNENATFTYYVEEPVDAAGFSDSILSMTKVFYKVGNTISDDPKTAIDFTGQGWINSSLTSMPNGGYFVFHVPHTVFAYNQYVWAWVNITDRQYNNNLTFQPGQVPYVRINDTILPYFNWGGNQNNTAVSYHVNKTIHVTITEPADASRLQSIRLYWRVNNSVSLPSSYDGYWDFMAFSPTGGTYYLDVPNTNFTYNSVIHFMINITDFAGNKNYSLDTYPFLIIDLVAPEYVADPLNVMFFWLQPGKSKNFTFDITDPDYATGRCSGTQRVEFWYKLDGPGFDLDFRWNATILLPAAGNVVTFQLPYNESFAQEDCTLYYMIKVYDVYDDAYATPPLESSQILIYKATSWDVTVTSPKALPWAQKYYHNHLDITFRFVCTGTLGFSKFTAWTAVWYSIDNGPIIGPVTPGGDLSIVFTNASLAEGHHNITVWHYNNSLVGFLEFKLDVTPPAAPTVLTATYTDDGVQLDWTGISDEDTVYYVIYRGFKPDFDITSGDADLVRSNLVTGSFLDEDILLDLTNYYYKVYAVDPAGNLSEVAATASFSKPFPMWMWIVIAGVALGVVVGLVVLIRARGERKLLSAAMEKSVKQQPISKEEDWTRVAAAARKRQEGAPAESKANAASAASDGKKWTTIQTSPAAAKPVAQQPAPAARGAYWKGELGELLAKVVQAEEAGNYAEELRVLEIVQRVAQQMQDQETLTMAQQKIKDIWAKINA